MECPDIPELSSTDFFAQFRQKFLTDRVPVRGTLELTFRCNLRCAHCYVVNAANSLKADEELGTREVYGILDQCADEGCLWLLLTGGEPLLRPDFLEIYTYAKQKGLLITLFTNGTLLTPYIADYLEEWRPRGIEITLYGRTRETYERVTGVKGSYDRCIKGIDLLLERNLPLSLKTVVMTWNKHELWDIKAYAESLGVDFRFDALINACYDGSDRPKAVRLPPEEVVALDLADAKRMEKWHEFCAKFLRPPSDPEHLYTCGAGLNSFNVDPSGRMSICTMVRQPAYDLRTGTFIESWKGFLPEVRAQKPKDMENYVCGQCELHNLCGQCPGWGQMEAGNQESRVEYLCQIAHLRAQAFGYSGRFSYSALSTNQ